MNFNNIFEHKIETNKTSAYILQDAFLENFIKKVNDHTAKITQEMHELNFTFVYAEHSGLKYHLSNPCSRAVSFKKLLELGVAGFKTGHASHEAAQKAVDTDITEMLSRPASQSIKCNSLLQATTLQLVKPPALHCHTFILK